MDKEETAAPFPEGENGGGDSGYGEHVHMYPMMVENNLKNLNTPVSNELPVKRNELTERHLK